MEGDDEIRGHFDSVTRFGKDGEMGSYLLMSLLIGILVVPIIEYGQKEESDIGAVDVVIGINITVRFLGATALIFAFVSIHHHERDWISEKSSSPVIKTKLGFLFIFGLAKIIFTIIYVTFYLKCRNMISSELTNVIAAEGFTNIIFIILQLIFFMYVGQYSFISRPTVRYVASLIAMGNFTDLLVFMTLSVNGNKDLIFDKNNTATVNCTGYSPNVVENLISVSKEFRSPIAVQFSILAITLAFSMKPDTEKFFNSDKIRLQFSWKTPKRLAKIMVVVVLMNVPLLVCAPFNFVFPDSKSQSKIWLSLMLAQKSAIFGCLLGINYQIFKKLKVYVKNVALNANETVLLVSTVGVVSYLAIQTFLQPNFDSILTSLAVISLLSILYQVTIILFGRRMVLVGNDIYDIYALQQLVVILVCNNMSVWFNDFLYGLWDMSNDNVLRHSLFQYIAMILYPLIAYYRFQSAMELMGLYRHLS
ncbi:uncharacterized protein LOC133205942 [Saccostrea echinata]|uniref:uncharacterized protein LOC133205942 n=1 Tax=Saccostrea echinata TaxID=191078 RepID=UPI002A7ED31F|nr:uncharacterized protein LOC133205942 [Saccostrea echinata]